jgi:dolichyl-phosphate beta-glucosyltransferase
MTPTTLRGDLSIVIPAFNEAGRIAQTIHAVSTCAAQRFDTYEVIVADDGSIDETAAVVARLGGILPVRLVREQANRGKGHAVRRGVAASAGDLVLITDADLSTPLSALDRLLDAIGGGADIVFGSRGLPESRVVVHQPLYRELLGRGFNLLVRATVLPGVRDTQCGFKLFRGPIARAVFGQSVIDGFAFDVEVLTLAVRAGYRVMEVPVTWSHAESSRVRVLRDVATMFADWVRIVRHSRRDGHGAPQAGGPEDPEPFMVSGEA